MPTFAGFDVGGPRKGFHGVLIDSERIAACAHFADAPKAAAWCRQADAIVVAIDSPCGWSAGEKSREAERKLKIAGRRIPCFCTPSEKRAKGNPFYDWVRNGLKLYAALEKDYPLFTNVSGRQGPLCFETFPHALVCHCLGHIVPANPKAAARRKVLASLGYDIAPLRSVDFLDAALCAHAARNYCSGDPHAFGNSDEGWIVVPDASR
jgi:predicted nuclease with RNAse H fold